MFSKRSFSKRGSYVVVIALDVGCDDVVVRYTQPYYRKVRYLSLSHVT